MDFEKPLSIPKLCYECRQLKKKLVADGTLVIQGSDKSGEHPDPVVRVEDTEEEDSDTELERAQKIDSIPVVILAIGEDEIINSMPDSVQCRIVNALRRDLLSTYSPLPGSVSGVMPPVAWNHWTGGLTSTTID